jgi:hypothetical protein
MSYDEVILNYRIKKHVDSGVMMLMIGLVAGFGVKSRDSSPCPG